MANYKGTDTDLTAVAAAIRAKRHTSSLLEWPIDYISTIQELPEPPIDYIEVTTLPTKTTYTDGETIDYTGIEVTGYWNDESSAGVIPVADLTFPMTTIDASDFVPYKTINGNRVKPVEISHTYKNIAYLGSISSLGVYTFDDGRLQLNVHKDGRNTVIDTTYKGTLLRTNQNPNMGFPLNIGYYINTSLGVDYVYPHAYVQGGDTSLGFSSINNYGVDISMVTPQVPVKYIRPEDETELTTGFDVTIS